MERIRRQWAPAAVLVLIALCMGCEAEDPARNVLKTRRLWNVDLSGFVQREDGAISAQFRLSGPVDNRLDDLTVKIELLDAAGGELSTTWESFDLRDVKRGGPVERFLTISGPGDDAVVESIRLDPVHYPETADYAHILELAGLAPTGE
ncbi:MAG: hypothetical protein IFK94_10100 [Acidobacteria bacterium]|uniref:Uncharacterized protein n=1 Tax=Candidatus Polarisedimenticola svalbardensis TaxID=2886004 RepID=A0A8J6Y1J8_9BACT|nr:hypothetical protein [Candidatus Polarisedimenticola svalbardensis]